MKKILALLLVLAMAVSLVACGSGKTETKAPETQAPAAEAPAAEAPKAEAAASSKEEDPFDDIFAIFNKRR